jgi:prophage tail gpP-like protein
LTTTYSIKAGDTYESIARSQYGDPTQADVISAANPAIKSPLQVGTTINIPDDPNPLPDKDFRPVSSQLTEVTVLIDNNQFTFWTSIQINRSIDSFDTFVLTAPFDLQFRDVFVPLSYKEIKVAIGSEFIFVGTLVRVQPMLEVDRNHVILEGYAKPAVLGEVMPPRSEVERLEFRKVDIGEISVSLCKPFGVGVSFDTNVGAGEQFPRVSISRTRIILGFLIELAKQRNLIISNTPQGKLLFLRSKATGQLVAKLEQGESPLLSARANFNAQQYYSDITGFNTYVPGDEVTNFTAKNERLKGVIRPTMIGFSGGLTEIKEGTQAALGRMFANAVSYSVTVATWRDAGGDLWKTNTRISLVAAGVMIYDPFVFVIRSVQFLKSVQGETATLELVLPGAFSGEEPERMPWE